MMAGGLMNLIRTSAWEYVHMLGRRPLSFVEYVAYIVDKAEPTLVQYIIQQWCDKTVDTIIAATSAETAEDVIQIIKQTTLKYSDLNDFHTRGADESVLINSTPIIIARMCSLHSINISAAVIRTFPIYHITCSYVILIKDIVTYLKDPSHHMNEKYINQLFV